LATNNRIKSKSNVDHGRKGNSLTYRQLIVELSKLNEYQLDCDVTVEMDLADECYPAELMICSTDHDSLDEDHPVLFVRD
jgi:hypothetical protein